MCGQHAAEDRHHEGEQDRDTGDLERRGKYSGDLVTHRLAGDERLTEVTLERARQVGAELAQERFVDAGLLTNPLQVLGRGLTSTGRPDVERRVTRQQSDHREREESEEEHDSEQTEESLDGEAHPPTPRETGRPGAVPDPSGARSAPAKPVGGAAARRRKIRVHVTFDLPRTAA